MFSPKLVEVMKWALFQGLLKRIRNQRNAALMKTLEKKKGYYHKFCRKFRKCYNLVIQEPASFTPLFCN